MSGQGANRLAKVPGIKNRRHSTSTLVECIGDFNISLTTSIWSFAIHELAVKKTGKLPEVFLDSSACLPHVQTQLLVVNQFSPDRQAGLNYVLEAIENQIC